MKVDMSLGAVEGRLKLVSQLWRLSISLGNAKRETEAKRNEPNNENKDDRNN